MTGLYCKNQIMNHLLFLQATNSLSNNIILSSRYIYIHTYYLNYEQYNFSYNIFGNNHKSQSNIPYLYVYPITLPHQFYTDSGIHSPLLKPKHGLRPVVMCHVLISLITNHCNIEYLRLLTYKSRTINTFNVLHHMSPALGLTMPC